MPARKRLPSGRPPVERCTPNAASRAGLQRALQALHGTAQPIAGDEAVRVWERQRRDERVHQPDLLPGAPV